MGERMIIGNILSGRFGGLTLDVKIIKKLKFGYAAKSGDGKSYRVIPHCENIPCCHIMEELNEN